METRWPPEKQSQFLKGIYRLPVWLRVLLKLIETIFHISRYHPKSTPLSINHWLTWQNMTRHPFSCIMETVPTNTTSVTSLVWYDAYASQWSTPMESTFKESFSGISANHWPGHQKPQHTSFQQWSVWYPKLCYMMCLQSLHWPTIVMEALHIVL